MRRVSPISLASAGSDGPLLTRHRRGVTLPITDTLIAATALVHGATVVTGNFDQYPMSEVAILPLPRSRK